MNVKQRYLQFKSVGCWFDLYTGFTFAITKDNETFINPTSEELLNDKNDLSVVHIDDTSEEWNLLLTKRDKKTINLYNKCYRLTEGSK